MRNNNQRSQFKIKWSVKRNFVYIKDVTDAFIKAGEQIENKDVLGETFNISQGEQTTILSLVKKIMDICIQ